jgi:hypothetical protein
VAENSDNISLRDYVDVRFTAQERAVSAAMAASEKAIDKAERTTGERLVLLNELRGTVPTREEFQALQMRFDDLKAKLDKMEGKSTGANALWGYALGVAGFLASIAAVVVVVSK